MCLENESDFPCLCVQPIGMRWHETIGHISFEGSTMAITTIGIDLAKNVGDASNQLKWYLSIKAPITFSWSSMEREKQMVLRANRLMRVLSVRLLRLMR